MTEDQLSSPNWKWWEPDSASRRETGEDLMWGGNPSVCDDPHLYGLGRPGGVQLAETGQTRRGACLVEGVELNMLTYLRTVKPEIFSWQLYEYGVQKVISILD